MNSMNSNLTKKHVVQPTNKLGSLNNQLSFQDLGLIQQLPDKMNDNPDIYVWAWNSQPPKEDFTWDMPLAESSQL